MWQVVLWIVLVLAIGGGLGWLLSRGRLGEMPELVDDRPQPRLPEGRWRAADVAQLRFASAPQGYQKQAVDDVLRMAKQALTRPDEADLDAVVEACGNARFPMARGGYQMGQVDAVLDRLARQFRIDQLEVQAESSVDDDAEPHEFPIDVDDAPLAATDEQARPGSDRPASTT